jgi:hypothetical protein
VLETNRDGEVVVSCVVKGGSAFEHGISEVLCMCFMSIVAVVVLKQCTRDLCMCWRASVMSNGHDV